MTKGTGWHLIIDKNSERPKDDVVVGYYISGSYEFAILCYYDQKTKQWFSASPDTRGDELNEPDYWIEKPD